MHRRESSMKVCYLDNKDGFKKALFSKISPMAFDYSFFAADLFDALENNSQINIIIDGQTDTVNGKAIDAEIAFPLDLVGTAVIELQLKDGLRMKYFKFNVVLNKLSQVVSKKYYVNDESVNQVITMYFK